MISRSMPSGSSIERIRRSTSTTVLRSLKTGTMTESLRSFAGGDVSGPATRPLREVPVAHAGEPVVQVDGRLPPEQLPRPGDVGSPPRRVADRQRLEHDLGA